MMNETLEKLELLIELLEGCLQEEGYSVERFSKSKNWRTTSYDALRIADKTGDFAHISIDFPPIPRPSEEKARGK